MSQIEHNKKEVEAIMEGYMSDRLAGILTIDEYAGIWITMKAKEYRTENANA